MLDGAEYQITLVHLDGRADFRLVGEFDLAAAPDLRDELLGRLAGSIPVVVDMSDVTFMDSSALGVFIRAAKAAQEQGTTFRLVNVNGTPRRVLEISGMLDLLTGLESVPDS